VSDNEAASPAPADGLSDILSALHRETTRDALRLKHTERHRVNLLVVHALTALVIAPLFAASGDFITGPTWRALQIIPGFPLTMCAVLWAGGVLLLPAALLRQHRCETAGLALICFWYAVMALGFLIPTLGWVTHWTGDYLHGRHSPPESVAFYPWMVYLHPAVLMLVHLRSLYTSRHDIR